MGKTTIEGDYVMGDNQAGDYERTRTSSFGLVGDKQSNPNHLLDWVDFEVRMEPKKDPLIGMRGSVLEKA
jgi:hypothetical protein